MNNTAQMYRRELLSASNAGTYPGWWMVEDLVVELVEDLVEELVEDLEILRPGRRFGRRIQSSTNSRTNSSTNSSTSNSSTSHIPGYLVLPTMAGIRLTQRGHYRDSCFQHPMLVHISHLMLKY